MYPQQSPRSLWSLRLGACHFLVNTTLVGLGLILVAVGWMAHHGKWVWAGAITIALWMLSALVFHILSYCWTCPSCLGRLWVKTGCRRHHRASPFLGLSYRLGIATSTVLRKPYRCPYCGKPSSTTEAVGD